MQQQYTTTSSRTADKFVVRLPDGLRADIAVLPVAHFHDDQETLHAAWDDSFDRLVVINELAFVTTENT